MANTTAAQDRADRRGERRIDQHQNALRNELYELGRRAGAGRPRDGDKARHREIVDELADPEDAAIYDLGLADGEEVTPAAAKPTKAARPKPAAKRTASSRRRPPARRRSSSRRRSVPAQAAANLYAPVRGQLISGAQLVGMIAAVLLLSAMLQTADTWTGVFRKVADAFDWLSDPRRSITYGPNNHG